MKEGRFKSFGKLKEPKKVAGPSGTKTVSKGKDVVRSGKSAKLGKLAKGY